MLALSPRCAVLAGLINGWTETGTRPHFKIVTGVSTGALIAPFAFLGPHYDDELKASYTEVDSNRIFVSRGVLPLLWSEAMASTEPLEELISTYMTEDVLAAIAKEHTMGTAPPGYATPQSARE